ncbi:zinc-binding dehydrogenase [Oceanimonas sp. MB9]|uniref:quinone oxidoreductase family protein n=1 Tax=Oceanimonas sp. MB9 TaxID=2588453 RepID=UPI0013F64D25|nr:zinc-binding dehydrogenase [Oceanimonas sp. MB9]NHI00254.1 Quinone oxidoreductase 1 [Oceanimonas sp. MB9]
MSANPSYGISITANGTPEVLQPVAFDTPAPAAGEVLIRNHAGAVNFIDTIIRRGEMPAGMAPALPHIPGVEGAGVVEALGEGVKGLNVGDRVAWMGPIGAQGYSTHSVIAAPYVTRIADEVSFALAASLPVNSLTAWHMLVNLGRAKAGDWVLIHAAAGGVGTMALHIAKHLGLTTIASVSTDKQYYAESQGADYVIDYRNEDLTARVHQITQGRGVDISLNPVSGDSLSKDLDMLAPLGTAVLFGFLAGAPSGTFADDLAKHFQKSIAVRVSDIYTYFVNQPSNFHADMVTVYELLARGILRPNITTLPLEQAVQAHAQLESGQTTGKLVLTID